MFRWITKRAIALAIALGLTSSALLPYQARAQITIPASAKIADVPATPPSGLIASFVDVTTRVRSLADAQQALDSNFSETANVENVNFRLRNFGPFGPFVHDGADFTVQFKGLVAFKVAGDYRLGFSVDDGARLRIADITVLELDGLNFNPTIVSEVITVEEAGLYAFDLLYFDGLVCCAGVRLGGVGPEGSDLVASVGSGFNFGADLGPASFAGLSNPGPGNSVLPPSVFFQEGDPLPARDTSFGRIKALFGK